MEVEKPVPLGLSFVTAYGFATPNAAVLATVYRPGDTPAGPVHAGCSRSFIVPPVEPFCASLHVYPLTLGLE
jgi:hypothetical protein